MTVNVKSNQIRQQTVTMAIYGKPDIQSKLKVYCCWHPIQKEFHFTEREKEMMDINRLIDSLGKVNSKVLCVVKIRIIKIYAIAYKFQGRSF